ncbi:hypothetical protein Tco_0210049 [Tanacetum coccineum]
MAVLESCPKHNMVAFIEKTEGNAEFHEVIDFLARSSIHHALTVSPVVSTTFVEQFWMSAKSKIINNVRYITAKVAGKPVSISEASIRSDLLFDDADGIDSLPNQAIFDDIQLMVYEGDLTMLTFHKALFSPQWRHLDAKKKFVMYPRFISIFLDKQLVNVPVLLDHFPVNALTSKVFSFMVKKGKHFSRKVTPLFASMLVQSTEDEGATSERPSEPQPTPSPPHPKVSGGNQGGQSSSDRSLSGTEGGMTLQSVYDLCISLCTQVIDQAKEIKHLKAQIKKLKKKAKPIITHHRSWMKSGRKSAKAKPSVHKDPLFDELDDDEIDNMDTEDAQDVGRTRNGVNEEKEGTEDAVSTEDVVSTDKEKVSTDRSKVSTDRSKDSTDKDEEGTDRDKDSTVSLDEGTDDRTEARSATSTTPTTTPTMFGDDETIAQVLLNMSQAKAVSREKEKGVELKDEEATKTALLDEYDFIQARIEADRLLALRLQDEEREQFTVEERAKFLHDTIAAQRRFLAEQRAIAIRNKPPTRTQLRNQMMTYLKHVGNKKHSDLKSKTFEEIQALYEKVKRFDESFTAVGSTEDERRIKEMNEGVKDTDQKRLKEEDIEKVPAKVEVTEQGTLDSEIMEKKSVIARLDKVSSPDGDYLVIYIANGNFRAFNYLIEYSEITLEGFEFILWGNLKIMMESSTEENDQSEILEHKKLASPPPKAMACGKRLLKSFMVDNLQNLGFLITLLHGEELARHWLVQKKMVFGKDKSIPLMVDSLPKTVCGVEKTQVAVKMESVLRSSQDVLKCLDTSSRPTQSTTIISIPEEELNRAKDTLFKQLISIKITFWVDVNSQMVGVKEKSYQSLNWRPIKESYRTKSRSAILLQLQDYLTQLSSSHRLCSVVCGEDVYFIDYLKPNIRIVKEFPKELRSLDLSARGLGELKAFCGWLEFKLEEGLEAAGWVQGLLFRDILGSQIDNKEDEEATNLNTGMDILRSQIDNKEEDELRDLFRLSTMSIAKSEAKEYNMMISQSFIDSISDLAYKYAGTSSDISSPSRCTDFILLVWAETL